MQALTPPERQAQQVPDARGENSGAQLVYQTIKDMISKQALLPGQQLVESEIATICGVSRTPVREAFRMLQKEGMVEIVKNKGTFLRIITKDDMIMGLEAGEALEGIACWLIAEKIQLGLLDPGELSPLEQHIAEMEHYLSTNQIKEWSACDEQFHSYIFALSGNSIIIQQRQRLSEQLNHMLWYLTLANIDRRLSTEDHRSMLTSIRDGDCDGARLIAQKHRHRTRNVLKQL